jgi:hypothetical protein
MNTDSYDRMTFKVGDLVEFIGFNYTPDYYIEEEEQYMIGIVVEATRGQGVYITGAWMYRVYWFKTNRTTETVAAHLKLMRVRRSGG